MVLEPEVVKQLRFTSSVFRGSECMVENKARCFSIVVLRTAGLSIIYQNRLFQTPFPDRLRVVCMDGFGARSKKLIATCSKHAKRCSFRVASNYLVAFVLDECGMASCWRVLGWLDSL